MASRRPSDSREGDVPNGQVVQNVQSMNQDPSARPSCVVAKSSYRAPWWLPGGHLQTIYARSLARNLSVPYRRERWRTPDEDFIDIDWLASTADQSRIVVLFHGLEGCSRSHYAISLMDVFARCGWMGVVPHFRGCGDEANCLPRSYHAGDSQEIDWILRRLKDENPARKIFVIAISLGANMLLKWLGECGAAAQKIVERAVGVSAPLDLQAAARQLDFGFKRILYTRYFLQTMRPKVLAKISAHGLAIEARAVRSCSTFRAIDDLYTAPVHGFKSADDYWTNTSSKPWLKTIRVPTLVINARNDPFLPERALPDVEEVSDAVTLEFPDTGGHVGFVTGKFPGRLDWLPKRAVDFFAADPHGVNISLTEERLVPG
jgi:predicted alpha/beta-fold hydrolase